MSDVDQVDLIALHVSCKKVVLPPLVSSSMPEALTSRVAKLEQKQPMPRAVKTAQAWMIPRLRSCSTPG